MRSLWIALVTVGLGCSSGAGSPQGGGPLNESPSPYANSGQEGPGGPPGQEAPGSGGSSTGQGGTGNVGQGGTGNVGTGGGGGADCNSICTNDCGYPADTCGPLCANATADQLACAQAQLPDCEAAANCFLSGTGGSGTGGSGTGGATGGCSGGDCTGCTDACSACICSTGDETTCVNAGLCG